MGNVVEYVCVNYKLVKQEEPLSALYREGLWYICSSYTMSDL